MNLPAVESAHSGCLNCAPRAIRAKLRLNPHPGFGVVTLLRDGEGVAAWYVGDKCPTFITFERRASADPDHDWRVQVDGPLADFTYQRHAPKEWVIVARGLGFA